MSNLQRIALILRKLITPTASITIEDQIILNKIIDSSLKDEMREL